MRVEFCVDPTHDGSKYWAVVLYTWDMIANRAPPTRLLSNIRLRCTLGYPYPYYPYSCVKLSYSVLLRHCPLKEANKHTRENEPSFTDGRFDVLGSLAKILRTYVKSYPTTPTRPGTITGYWQR